MQLYLQKSYHRDNVNFFWRYPVRPPSPPPHTLVYFYQLSTGPWQPSDVCFSYHCEAEFSTLLSPKMNRYYLKDTFDVFMWFLGPRKVFPLLLTCHTYEVDNCFLQLSIVHLSGDIIQFPTGLIVTKIFTSFTNMYREI